MKEPVPKQHELHLHAIAEIDGRGLHRGKPPARRAGGRRFHHGIRLVAAGGNRFAADRRGGARRQREREKRPKTAGGDLHDHEHGNECAERTSKTGGSLVFQSLPPAVQFQLPSVGAGRNQPRNLSGFVRDGARTYRRRRSSGLNAIGEGRTRLRLRPRS
jgi:hypothetical protein